MGLLPTYSPQPVNLRSLYFDAPAPAGIASRTPNLGERITDALHGMGMDQRQANRLGDKVSGALNMFTPLGAIPEAQQAKSSYRTGNYGSALAHGVAAAVSAVPDGGMFAHGAGAVAHSIIAPLFHGSPHAFEKFALEKIGTGEGAQAYGHGLYFAENPDVAKEYQQALSKPSMGLAVNGKLVTRDNPVDYVAADLAHMSRGNEADISKDYGSVKKWAQADIRARGLGEHESAILKRLNDLSGQDISKPWTNGHLYEVQLDANPEDFLNWDAPLTQQPAALGRVRNSPPEGVSKYEWLKSFLDAEYMSPREVNPFGTAQLVNGNLPSLLGSAPAVSEAMRKGGIPGIRYLDQGSRNIGQNIGQTHNYVVFDPSIIDILNRH